MSKEKVNNNVEGTKKCKFCYTDININATVCPNCKRQQNSTKGGIISSIFALMILLVIGYFGWQIVKPLFFSKPDYKDFDEYEALVPKELQKAYIENEISAKEKYSGNYYYFSGTVNDVDEGLTKNEITFRYKYKEDNSSQIEFYANFSKDYDRIKAIKKGDNLTVYCKFYDRIIDNYMGVTSGYSFKNCQIKD